MECEIQLVLGEPSSGEAPRLVLTCHQGRGQSVGQGQGGFGEEVVEASHGLCVRASILAKADGAREGLVTFAQVKSAGCGVINTLFDWAVIILLRSQNLSVR